MNGTDDNPNQAAGDDASGRGRTLSNREASELTEHIARLTQAGLPLAQGLRAAAKEASGKKLNSTLDYVADQLEKGRPLDEILTSPEARLPDYVRRLLSAAVQSGKVDQVLLELMDHFRRRRDRRRSLTTALAYPAVLLLALAGLTAIVFGLVLPQYRILLEDVLQGAISEQTQFLLWVADTVVPAILPCLGAVAVLALAVRMLGGPARWRRLLWGIPIFGPLFSWSGTSELSRLLRILLQHGIPLPEALRLSSEGVSDAYVATASQALAEGVESGKTLHDTMFHATRLPESMIPIVRWGEQNDCLPDALQTASELLDGRLRLRTLWLTSVLPPFVFVLVGALVVTVMGCLLGPLVWTIQTLSTFTTAPARQPAAFESVGTGLFSLGIIGLALLLAVKIAHVRRSAIGDDALLLAMTTAGWVLLLLGFLGTMCFLAFPLGFFFSLVTIAILAMAVTKFRACERRSLLWVLAVSAERGLPLAPAARAFAAERSDERGRRAMRLASLLNAGMALPDALDRSGNRLPTDARLAARVGSQTQDIGVLLREVAQDRDRIGPAWQSAYERSLYFVYLLAFASGTLAFLLWRVVPTYEKIFQDYGTKLPRITTAVIGASGVILQYGVIAVPLFVLLLGVCVIGVFYYMGWMWWEPSVLYPFTRRIHSANVMRCLSHTLNQGMSLIDSLDLLQRSYPKRHVALRLASACKQIEQGSDWCSALRQADLATKSDAAVLRAAVRVGNLPWALHEMADSSLRRLLYRMTAFQQIAIPVVVVAFGLIVALYAVAFILPIAKLVEAMSYG